MTKRTETEATNPPAFKNEAEAAAFWDTHSPLDYPQDFTETEVTFDRPLIKRGLTIKLSEHTIEQLRELAARRRVRKRDVSFGPRSEPGAKAWDTFMTLAATTQQLGVSFIAYLQDRFRQVGQIPPLADLLRARAATPTLGGSWASPYL